MSNSLRNISENQDLYDEVKIIEIDPDEKVNVPKRAKYKELNNRYIKGERLGKGSYATVRECIDKTSLKRYAVKIMRKADFKRFGAHRLKNIEREMNLTNKLDHKNVMKTIDSFTALSQTTREPKQYIVVEYCAGVLTEIIDAAPEQRLPVWQSHHYFCQIINGLKYLHSSGIYHRDIKEDNILIDNSHVVKICDFGVSHLSGLFTENDIISDCEGSQLYQPPELYHSDEYSGSAFDIWSSGVVLFKMVSAKYPFFNSDETPFQIKSYEHLKYPKEIIADKQLLELLKRIFDLNFKTRIKIKAIKDHPWVRLKHKTDGDRRVEFPAKQFGDIYRGMSLLERLRVRYEYEKVDKPIELVNEREYEESLKPKEANVRPNRSPMRKRERRRRISATRRLVRLGLNRE